jgi:hypothetical protein
MVIMMMLKGEGRSQASGWIGAGRPSYANIYSHASWASDATREWRIVTVSAAAAHSLCRAGKAGRVPW